MCVGLRPISPKSSTYLHFAVFNPSVGWNHQFGWQNIYIYISLFVTKIHIFHHFDSLNLPPQVVILQASAPSAPHPRATRGAATPAPSPPRTAPPWSPRRRSAAAARRGWRADEGRRWRPPSDPGALGWFFSWDQLGFSWDSHGIWDGIWEIWEIWKYGNGDQ